MVVESELDVSSWPLLVRDVQLEGRWLTLLFSIPRLTNGRWGP